MALKIKPAVMTATAFALLAACGGGGGPTVLGPGRVATPEPGTLQSLNATSGGDSTIAGTSLQTQPSTSITLLSAQLSAQTGNLTQFNNGVTQIGDLDDSNGGWRDDSGNLLLVSDALERDGGFTYSRVFNFIAAPGSSPDLSGTVILGVVTPGGSIPNTGSLSYSGQAFINGGIDGADSSIGTRGTAIVDANFTGTQNVTVTISAFNDPVPFDSITLDDFDISNGGNTFEVGTVTLFDAGNTDITGTLLGSVTGNTAAGHFFGLDAVAEDSQPDEVGGMFFAEGTNGEIYGGFMAD